MQNDKVRDLTKMAMCVALCCATAYISLRCVARRLISRSRCRSRPVTLRR